MIGNLTPGFTFILAIIFRMENLALRSLSTWAKIIGTVVSVSGAMLVVLFIKAQRSYRLHQCRHNLFYGLYNQYSQDGSLVAYCFSLRTYFFQSGTLYRPKL
ncbi:hypothetical protein AB3S75_010343 [Citrus x aurantiifolia]